MNPKPSPPGGYDRYKASSYRAYNFKLPQRYDTSLVTRLCGVSRMDAFVLAELGSTLATASILDVGCATGRLLLRLARAGAEKLAGADLAPRILDVARHKLAGTGVECELKCADSEDRLPWDSGTFDVVTLTGVLHHFYRPLAALREVARVLRTGGRLILVDPCFFFPVRQIFNLCLRIHPHEGDCHFFSMREAGRLLGMELWAEARCQRLDWCFFCIVATRSAGGFI